MTTEQIADAFELVAKGLKELITDKTILDLMEDKVRKRFLEKRDEVLDGLLSLQQALKASRKEKRRINAWLPKE